MDRWKVGESFPGARPNARSISSVSSLLTHAAERQIELASYFRPELAQHVESHVLKDVKSAIPRRRGHARLVAGMVQIVERQRTPRRQPLGVVEHQSSV